MSGEPISFTLSTRPIRVLYVATSQEEVMQAVKLYTHLWGGAANAILPLPMTGADIQRFVRAVRRFDPDVLLTSINRIESPLAAIVNELPSPIRQVTGEAVAGYIEGREPLTLLSGEATHPAALLEQEFPVRVAEPTNIRMLEAGSHFGFELALHFGAASEVYLRYLRDHLGGRILRSPAGPDELIKSLLISAQRVTPASLSLRATRMQATHNFLSTSETTPLESDRIESERTLFLFLSGTDVETSCAFWNSRRASTHVNKLLLPREPFLQSIPLCLEVLPIPEFFDSVVVFASVPGDEARHIHERIRNYLADRGADVPVAVYHRGVAYEMWRGGAYWGPAASSTRLISTDTSLTFVPAAPPAHDRSRSVFGYDAEIQFTSGAKLSLPRTRSTTRLLLNTTERLQRARENEGGAGELWLRRSQDVRARPGGLAGFTEPGNEVRIYLHPADVLIREVLLGRRIRVRPSKHTRYARGFIRRFGGVEKTLRLIREGGGHIIGAFLRHRGEEGGVSPQRIASHVCARLGCDIPAANLLVREHLPRLVAAGLVRRGVVGQFDSNRCK